MVANPGLSLCLPSWEPYPGRPSPGGSPEARRTAICYPSYSHADGGHLGLSPTLQGVGLQSDLIMTMLEPAELAGFTGETSLNSLGVFFHMPDLCPQT